MKLRVDVFCLSSGKPLCSGVSASISDSASKAHGAMDLYDVTPLRSCSLGGRKIVMIAEFGLAKDVVPVFQLYSSQGERIAAEEERLNQPDREKTVIRKGAIIFISPPQPHAELFFDNNWEVKACAMRLSDSMVSAAKFTFEYVPHHFYGPCIFCEIGPDLMGMKKAEIRPQKDLTRPGLKRRVLHQTEIEGAAKKTLWNKNLLQEKQVSTEATVELNKDPPMKDISQITEPVKTTDKILSNQMNTHIPENTLFRNPPPERLTRFALPKNLNSFPLQLGLAQTVRPFSSLSPLGIRLAPQLQSYQPSPGLVTLLESPSNLRTAQSTETNASNIKIEGIKEEPPGAEEPQVNSFIEVNSDIKPEPYDASASTSTMIIPYHDFEEHKTINMPI